MAKTFKSVKVGDYLRLRTPEWYDKSFSNVHDYIAEVTNVDIYGDELIISYKTSQYNHTIRVHKNQTFAVVWSYKRQYKNYEYYQYTHSSYWLNIYKGGVPENYKSQRQYRKTSKLKYSYHVEPIE